MIATDADTTVRKAEASLPFFGCGNRIRLTLARIIFLPIHNNRRCQMTLATIKKAIRDVPDFPKQGIIFKDVTPLLANQVLFAEVIDMMASRYTSAPPAKIIGIESRGFIFGAALALRLKSGFVPVRKKGKLPYRTIEASYDLEYGSATIEMHTDALAPGESVIIVDDLLATGGTAGATAALVENLGATILGLEFLVELSFLKGRTALSKYRINSIIQFD